MVEKRPMKTPSVKLLALAIMALCGISSAEKAPGLWWVSHGDGAPLQVRLYPDGSAWSDYPSNNPGTWSRREDRIVCLWADGWKEVFEPTVHGWSKLGYTPETDLTAPPSNRSKAFRVTSAPDGWFGVSP